MYSIEGRSGTALVVIDVQVAVVSGAWRRDEVIGNISHLVRDARAHHVPVVWVQHSDDGMPIGSDDWQLVAELQPADGEPIVHKRYRSSFEGTDLEAILAERHAGHLIICGAQTEFCVRNTVHSAYDRGYDVTLIEDAHTTWDAKWQGRALSAAQAIDSQNRACSQYELPGRTCSVASTADAFTALTL